MPGILRRYWLTFVSLPLVAATLLVAAFLFSPDALSDSARRAVSRELDDHFDGLYRRAREGRATAADRFDLRVAYGGMLAFGHVVYPEAAKILGHYLAGRTDDLIIDADYFRQSPVVRRALAKGSCGRIGPIAFRVHEDPRLAYAVNGFFLDVRCEGTRRHVDLNQRIVFASLQGRERPITPLRVGRFQVRFDDALIHVFDREGACKPFDVHVRWAEER